MSDADILPAVIDRIIPADDDPSASSAGVLEYLEHVLRTDAAASRERIEAGLRELADVAEQRFGRSFGQLPADDQDRLLAEREAMPFFRDLVRLTTEGYYADPAQGGNRDGVAWRMTGYRPLPEELRHDK